MDLQCTPQEHYEWLYLDNPEKINPTIVAEKDGKIIGVNHGLLMRIKVGKKVFLCLKGTDLAVHPDYRNKGVNKKIDELHNQRSLKSGSRMGFYLTKNPIVINQNLKSGGLMFPGEIRILVRIQNIDTHLSHTTTSTTRRETFTLKYGFLCLKNINKITNLILPTKTTHPKDLKILKITKFDDKLDNFWNEIKNDYDFIVEKSSNYLNWRYCDIRGGSYDIYIAEENGKMMGLLVLRINRYDEEYPTGYIMELNTLRNRTDVPKILLKKAIDYFDKEKINVIFATIVKEHPLEGLFYKNGFIDSRKRTFVGINPNDLEGELTTFMKANKNRLNYQYSESDTI